MVPEPTLGAAARGACLFHYSRQMDSAPAEENTLILCSATDMQYIPVRENGPS